LPTCPHTAIALAHITLLATDSARFAGLDLFKNALLMNCRRGRVTSAGKFPRN
jgi:hypothetical protein